MGAACWFLRSCGPRDAEKAAKRAAPCAPRARVATRGARASHRNPGVPKDAAQGPDLGRESVVDVPASAARGLACEDADDLQVGASDVGRDVADPWESGRFHGVSWGRWVNGTCEEGKGRKSRVRTRLSLPPGLRVARERDEAKQIVTTSSARCPWPVPRHCPPPAMPVSEQWALRWSQAS